MVRTVAEARCRRSAYPRPRRRLDPRRGQRPGVKAMAKKLGVQHFSRSGKPEYNQPDGPFRARTKAGNHNAWRFDPRTRLRRRRADGPRPRAAAELPGAHRRLLPRPRRRVRRRPAGLRQHVRRLGRARRVGAAVPVQRPDRTRRQRPRRAAAHRHQPPLPAPGVGADRRVPGQHHRGPPDLDGRAWASNNPLTDRRWKGVYTPDVHRRRRGPDHLDRLLQPAETLGLRGVGDPAAPQQGTREEAQRRAAALLRPRPVLLPERRAVRGVRDPRHRRVPRLRYRRDAGRVAAVADPVVGEHGQLGAAVAVAAPVQPRRTRTPRARRARHAPGPVRRSRCTSSPGSPRCCAAPSRTRSPRRAASPAPTGRSRSGCTRRGPGCPWRCSGSACGPATTPTRCASGRRSASSPGCRRRSSRGSRGCATGGSPSRKPTSRRRPARSS